MADKMATNLPADQRQQFKQMMTKDLDIAAVSKAMTDAMVKHFTTEELKALADFYGSPVGKSAMQKFGAYMADLMPIIQAEMMKAQAKLNQWLPNKSPCQTAASRSASENQFAFQEGTNSQSKAMRRRIALPKRFARKAADLRHLR
jgi:hypothetical protein